MIDDGYNDIPAMRRKIFKLKRELTQLREDRRVLADEVKAWRDAWAEVPCSKPDCVICTIGKTTDASGVLERSK